MRPFSTARVMAVTSALLASLSPAVAEDYPVRDCRDPGVVLPMVPSGFDAIATHATDDLMGPSIFQRNAKTEGGDGFEIEVRTYPSFEAQLADYLACETPFMRVTHAQMSHISDLTEPNPATAMVPIFFYGWSNGADAVISRGHTKVSELSGAQIVTDAARLDLALQLGQDVDTFPSITVSEDPAGSFASNSALDFAIVSAPQAEILTAGGVGTGAEGSVDGAREVLTTTSANRVIGHMLVVRKDFYDANPEITRATVRALLKAEEIFREDAKKQVVDFERASEMVLGDAALEDQMMTLWRGVETVGLAGLVDWGDPASARSFRTLINAGQTAMVAAGLRDAAVALNDPEIDFASLGDDIWDKRRTQTSGFDQDAATAAIQAMSNEDIDDSTIASVTILFEPQQAVFPVSQYQDAFEEALEKSRIYAGAVLSIEAHSSYLGYLRGVLKSGWEPPKQKRELASLRNISTARALSVRDALLETAEQIGYTIDKSQITIDGRGIEDPLGGFCNDLPCPPKTEEEWKASRRVIFRVIGMESEAEVFTPLNEW
ncbi:hypothetical protein R3X27_15720 [Tropicimonas sp. TH_r6]|uniref:hypothetical protein n=1 Tax=Tropicimonas sp. TH_r6 TaxID=3082085 RepID=UPI0029549401|nr:hypothetical protein [Tropicimonas sp. TH_r6]MDV7144136.1 hypothetical protein [Tropicimonas sp. TH_r6]